METLYFDLEHAIEVHDNIIAETGGSHGILNVGLLDSVLEHIQNDMYYPTFQEKATHLFYSINKNHAFNDGNKRSSIALCAYFFEINGLDYKVTRFIRDMENIAIDVAENRISKELLLDIMNEFVKTDIFSEELKLKIIRANTE